MWLSPSQEYLYLCFPWEGHNFHSLNQYWHALLDRKQDYQYSILPSIFHAYHKKVKKQEIQED